jgi:hypothetical protein
MFLLLPYLPLFAAVAVSVVVTYMGGEPYLTIVQDEAKATSNGSERTKGVRRLSHPTEE